MCNFNSAEYSHRFHEYRPIIYRCLLRVAECARTADFLGLRVRIRHSLNRVIRFFGACARCLLFIFHNPVNFIFIFLDVREQEKAEQSLKSVIWFLKKSDRRIILIPPRWPVNIVFSCRWRGFSVENMNNKTLYRAKVSTFQRWKHFGSKSFQQIFQLCENQMLSILYISTKYHQNV